jgi:Ty3 transposon capsid-like protein
MHQVPDHLRTKLATNQFHDKTSEWYDGYLMDHDPPDWPELVRLVRKRFNRQGSHNGIEELVELRQNGTVDEYIELFERLRSRLLVENRMFSESDFIDVFIGELKGEIKAFVKAFKPLTLDATFELAQFMEGAMESQYRKLKSFSKGPLPTLPIKPLGQFQAQPPKPVPALPPSRNVLMEQRRALGQCFKCGDKFFPGYQCKVKVQMLLGQELKDEDEGKQVNNLEVDEAEMAEEAIVSLYATHSHPQMSTMRFKGQVGLKHVYALLDSGSTHSFVDPTVLVDQKCQIMHTNPLIVMVANGSKMVTDFKYSALNFTLQGHEFTGDLRVL